jgi:hypothetical protein
MRIAVLSALSSSIVVYFYYSASLVSILSTRVSPVKSFQDILDYEFQLFGQNETLAIEAMFKVSMEIRRS